MYEVNSVVKIDVGFYRGYDAAIVSCRYSNEDFLYVVKVEGNYMAYSHSELKQ